jgi:hypothetical protein
LSADGALPSGLKVLNNHCVSNIEGGMTPLFPSYKGYAAALAFDAYQPDVANVTIQNNYWGSNNICAIWGFINGNGGNPVLQSDTFAFTGAAGTGFDRETFRLSRSTGPALCPSASPIIRDGIYSDGADDTNIVIDGSMGFPQELRLQSTLSITVQNGSAVPISGAYVYAVNNYGDTIMRDTSDVSGKAGKPVTYWWEANFSPNDSLLYNSFTLGAKYGGYSGTASLAVSDILKSAILTLSGYTPPIPGATRKLKGIKK